MELFPTLEQLRDGLDQLKPAWHKKIAPHIEDVFIYRELTRLKTDAAVDITLDDLRVSPAPRKDIADFLQNYELRSLVREIGNGLTPAQPTAATTAPSAAPAPSDGGQLSLFGAPARPAPEAAQAELPPLVKPEDLPPLAGRQAALLYMEDACVLAVDTQQYRLDAEPGELPVLLAPLLAKAESVATPSVKELLSAHDAWRALPIDAWFDLGLAAYLLSPEERVYTWERILDSLWTDPSFSPEEAPGGAPGLAALALAKRMRSRLEQAGLTELMRTLELPLIPVLVDMERRGIGIDIPAFTAFAAEVNTRLEALVEQMHRQAGVRFNVRSSQQLADVLYNQLGLKAPGKTPGGAASTSAEVLDRLAGQHPLVDTVLEYRKLEKLRSTYLEPLPALADAGGRIHTTFNQLTTATGRLSSSAPNLQNIPVRGDLGRRMRSLFIAGPGKVLASADYSQIELRVLAHFSGDPTLLAAFRENQDIHSRTAALLFDRPPTAITPEQRRQAKTINFGLLYGMGPQKLGRELGLSLAEAKDFIAKYFEHMGRLKEYYQTVVEQAKEQGYVTTMAGRRRMLPDIHSRNTQLEAQAKRQAVNTVVQGSAADIIKIAMLKAGSDQALAGLGAELILQVHDELVIEAPSENGQAAGERLAELMTGIVTLDVPLAVDMGVGHDWGGAH